MEVLVDHRTNWKVIKEKCLIAHIIAKLGFPLSGFKKDLYSIRDITSCLLWFFTCCLSLQLYRLERYDECLAVYRDLVRNSQDDYDEERKTNLSAVVAAQSNWEKVVPVSILALPTQPWNDIPVWYLTGVLFHDRRTWASKKAHMNYATMLLVHW